MKRISIIALVFLLAVGTASLFAQKNVDDFFFAPLSPKVMAQGNSFTAIAHGYESLFTNPAGFARGGGSFTLFSATASPYLPAGQLETVFDGIDAIENESGPYADERRNALFDLVKDNGIGANVSTGMGLVGRGIGLGLIVEGDLYGAPDPMADALLSTELKGHATVAAIAGLGYTLNLGKTDVSLGGNLRFMHRVRTDDGGITMGTLMDGFSEEGNGPTILAGNALAIDAGLIAERGPFMVGASFRDIGSTKFTYERFDAEAYGDSLGEDAEAIGIAVDDNYAIPMSISMGVAYHPDFGWLRYLIDPVFHAEYRHIFYSDDYYETRMEPSPWTRVHAGTEVNVLRFMKLRAGINQGYVTAGFGFKLLFMDINAAYFTRETGIVPGAKPNEGFSLEAAIRF